MTEWSPWFAWSVVRLEDGRRCWLRTVERRMERDGESGWRWTYRLRQV